VADAAFAVIRIVSPPDATSSTVKPEEIMDESWSPMHVACLAYGSATADQRTSSNVSQTHYCGRFHNETRAARISQGSSGTAGSARKAARSATRRSPIVPACRPPRRPGHATRRGAPAQP